MKNFMNGLWIAGFLAAPVYAQEARDNEVDLKVTRPVAAPKVNNASSTGKGYAKRPRQASNLIWQVSPAQLHDIYGAYGEVGYLHTNKLLIDESDPVGDDLEGTMRANQYEARGYYGVRQATFGFTAEYLQNELEFNSATQDDWKQTGVTVRPEAAFTIGKYVSLGLALDIVNEERELESSAYGTGDEPTATHNYLTGTAGVAYHNEKMEAGLAFAPEVDETEEFDNTDGLESDIYRPAEYTVYMRGNLSDRVSLLGKAAYADYTFESDDAVGETLFEQHYKLEDHTSGLLQLAFWTAARSRLGIGLTYAGAASRGAQSRLTNLLGTENLANMAGVQADLLFQETENFGISLQASYEVGSRDETVNGTRYAQSAEVINVGGGVSMRL